jgi:hypothetical protein
MTVQKSDYHPDYLQAMRELKVLLILFALAFGWSIAISYGMGYSPGNPSEPEGQVATTWGIPNWVFWGVLVPWLVVDVLAVWYCFVFMKADCDTNDSHDETRFPEQASASEHSSATEQASASEQGRIHG